MTVGKAKALAPKDGDQESRFSVPCFTSIDEARIRDHLQRDHFFWLDLDAPGREELPSWVRSLGSIRWRSRTPNTSGSDRSSTTTATTCFSFSMARGSTGTTIPTLSARSTCSSAGTT